MASSPSSKPQDPSPVSAPLGSPISPRFRRGSTHSLSASSAIDREQLAQTLDKIHISASRCDSLTTFKEFAPPTESAPASESRGSASELVQNGISGLYSRIREAVGGSALVRTAPSESNASNTGNSSKRISFAGGHSSRQSVSSTTQVEALDTPRSISSEQVPQTDAPLPAASTLLDRRSLPQTFKTNSLNLMTGPKSSSVSRQSLPTNATSSVVAASTIAAPVAAAHRDASRSTIRTNESGRQGSNHPSVEKNDSRGNLSSNLAKAPPDGTDIKIPLDSEDIETSSKDGSVDASAISSQNNDPRLLMKQGKHLRTGSTSSSAVVLPNSRKPAILDRLARSRSPPYSASHESSPDRGRISASRLNPSAHLFGHYDPSGHLSESQDQRSGVTRLSGAGSSNARASDQMNAQLDKMRRQVLSKEFWMKDDTVKECFLCQTPFSAFRRKHHCRTCGCIFDSKCTTVVPGEKFGVQSSLRVCKNCLEVITRRLEVDVSDDSGDDRSFLPKIYGPKLPRVPNGSDYPVGEHKAPHKSENSSDTRLVSTPLMAIPATRRVGDANRSSAILEIDAPQLSRPGSSRSLRSAMARPQSSGHRRHHSRHGLLGRFKSQFEDRAPSRRATEEDASHRARFPIFPDEDVNPEIDDDLSDDSSADEQLISTGQPVNAADLESAIVEDDKETLAQIPSSGRRQRHRSSEKAATGMPYVHRGQLDEVSGPASLNSSHRKPTRRRNVSNVSGSGHYLGSPRPRSLIFKGPTTSSEMLLSPENPGQGGVDLIRSDTLRRHSPKGDELNDSSQKHVNKLLEQLLTDAGIPSPKTWRRALVPILSRLTAQVTPNLAKGEDMDIRHYVKLKKIPGGRPGDTTYVSGVVFTKNLALKAMPRKISSPRIVLVTFPIEYQRHQQHFMSLQPVIEQEKEFLRVVVQRITNMRPHVLLAQKSVSGVALQYLSEANIAVAYNVKDTVIEAVARCAEAEIIESLDMLALPVRIGKCTAFEVRTFVNNDFLGRKKSYIFLSGCRPDLGCTVALRGADTKKLGKVKHILEFMVYVVYNLKLETSLLRDESIEPPEHGDGSVANATQSLNTSNSIVTPDGIESHGGANHNEPNTSEAHPKVQAATIAADPSRQYGKSTVQNASTTSYKSESVSLHESQSQASPDGAVPDDVPMPSFYSDMVAKYETKILSASPYVRFKQPYLLMKAREQERRLLYLRRLKDQDAIQQNAKDGGQQRFQLITPEMVDRIGQKAPRRILEVLHAVHDAEYDKALFNYQTQTRQWETHIQGNLDLFDPYSHQNIVVLYSVVCTDTKIPCIEPSLVALNFYDEQHIDTGMDPDCTLGQFIEDLAYGKNDTCNSNGCEKKMVDHHRTYVHDQYRITIFVGHVTSAIAQQMAFSDEITMWTYCKECKKDFGLKAMSEATFRYSFGKYLELLYWGRGLRLNKVIDCQHDRQHDHVRYFQLGDSRIRIHWDPIDLLEIIVPRARITWKVISDLRLKNEIYTKMEERWAKFMSSVRARLKSIRIDSILPEKAEACQAEIDRLTKEAQDEQAAMVRQLQSVYIKSKYYEVVPFNNLVREMLEKAGEWDQAFAKFETDFLGDKDIRQLTMLQLKKMFTDNESKESLVSQESTMSVASSEETSSRGVGDAEEKQASQSAELEAEAAAAVLSASHEDRAPMSQSRKPDENEGDGSLPAEDHRESLQRRNEPSSPVSAAFSRTPLQQAQGADDTQHKSQSTSADAVTSPLSMSPNETGLSLTESSLSARSAVENSEGRVIQTAHQDLPSTEPVSTAGKSAVKATERGSIRKSGSSVSPPMIRSTSHPSRTLPRSRSAAPKAGAGKEGKSGTIIARPDQPVDGAGRGDKKLSDRLSLGSVKPRSKVTPSGIPRLAQKRKESKVSTLARHFEQLSREFERERIRDRRERTASLRQPKARLPRTSTKAIVQVYDDVNEAFEEAGSFSEKTSESQPETKFASGIPSSIPNQPAPQSRTEVQTPKETGAELENRRRSASNETSIRGSNSQAPSDDEDGASDGEAAQLDDFLPGIKELADALEPSTEIPLELPKHQKTSLMKYLTNFWAERSASGWPPLECPVNATDHIFVDSDVIVREDEPSSVIALALNSDDYREKLETIRQEAHEAMQRSSLDGAASVEDRELPKVGASVDETELEKSLLRVTGTHLKYQFKEGSAVMTCKIFYAEQFDALRRKCGVAERIIESLSRCLKWDSRGGKTKSVFLKTLDDRLVLKSLSPVETSAFLRFAPGYFSIMAEALFHELPSVIAKMLGFFQVIIKNTVTGSDVKLDLLVTENLFYDRSPKRIFDLKGSMRNRKIQSTGEQNEVLLDENMVEYIYESPLFAREHSKRLLRASVWNDTLFLARQNVMDYSLMIAVDEERKELVVGIIDCIRPYTWDKKLESWIKDRGFAGGGRNRPTVTSPKEYKSRFREAMARYILQAPNCWHLFNNPQYPLYHGRPKLEEAEGEGQ